MQFSIHSTRATACQAKAVAQRAKPVVGAPKRPFQGAKGRSSLVCLASRPGGGVIDAPVNSTTAAPSLEKGTFTFKSRSPIYKVMLHNDSHNRREYVVRILLKVVEGFHMNDAVVCMQEAHETGVAMVTACAQDMAETYCESLRLNGLSVTMEPGC